MAGKEIKVRYEQIGDVVSIFQRGRRWFANFQLYGKQERPALKTSSKKEARRRAIQLEAEITQGRYRRTAPPPALADAIASYEKFLQTEGRAKKTLAKYTMILRRLLDLAGRQKVRIVAEVDL
jgi:hypothetical protein